MKLYYFFFYSFHMNVLIYKLECTYTISFWLSLEKAIDNGEGSYLLPLQKHTECKGKQILDHIGVSRFEWSTLLLKRFTHWELFAWLGGTGWEVGILNQNVWFVFTLPLFTLCPHVQEDTWKCTWQASFGYQRDVFSLVHLSLLSCILLQLSS